MSVRRRFHCPPEAVFAVLADGWSYPTWVVGASRMRAVDPDFPAPGSKLHHSAGIWPLLLNDTTSVLSYDPPRQIRLLARGWPAGTAKVTLDVGPDPDGCEVSITEDVNAGPAMLVPHLVRSPLIGWRNLETLRRLAFLAEGRAQRP